MYPLENRLTIMGRLDEIARARDFVAAIARDIGLSEKSVHHCTLAVDETCTNIIEHGYQHQGHDKTIDIICRVEPAAFIITIRDESPAFNPLLRGDPDPAATLEEREHGGWGIYFVKEFMDQVLYSRDGDYNQLTMSKNLS
ncbi:MAG: ATP-binding protein [Anaerolineae bacterium]|nr:ATP-binding protein [Anaerolineae bacterium]